MALRVSYFEAWTLRRVIYSPNARNVYLFPDGASCQVIVVHEVTRVASRVNFVLYVSRIICPANDIEVGVCSVNVRRVP